MRLRGDADQLLVIERSTFGELGLTDEEDVLLNVTVEVGGYRAADQVWIPSTDWRAYLSELREIERLRRGQASLAGAGSPYLKITIKSTDHAGHMCVLGFIRWDSPDGFCQRLEFGFKFDAGMLSTVLREFQSVFTRPE